MIHPGTSWALHCQRVSMPWPCVRAQCNMAGFHVEPKRRTIVMLINCALCIILKCSPKFIKALLKSKVFGFDHISNESLMALSCFQRRPPEAQGNSWGGLPHWCNTWRFRPVFFSKRLWCEQTMFDVSSCMVTKHVVESSQLDFKQQHSDMIVQTYRKGSPFYYLLSSNLISCRSNGSRKARWFLIQKSSSLPELYMNYPQHKSW